MVPGTHIIIIIVMTVTVAVAVAVAVTVTVTVTMTITIIIIIHYLYSALKSCKGYRGAGGFRLRLSKQVFFKGV